MKRPLLFCTRRISVPLLASLGLTLLCVPQGVAQSPTQDSQAASTASAAAAQTDAQKKAAERKKRFEEQKALLDGGRSPQPGATTHVPVTDKEFWIDPINVNMVARESQEIHVWDWRGNDVSARVSWNLSDTSIVDMKVQHHATITGKMPGTTSVIGTIDGHVIEAIVTVYRGEKLPDGVQRSVSKPLPLNNGGRHRVSTVTVQP